MWDFLSETSIIYKVKCIMVNKDSDIEIYNLQISLERGYTRRNKGTG